jgi:2-oxoglutarate dehydrogenase complex dehydrogenase (E1) component-like enzyme
MKKIKYSMFSWLKSSHLNDVNANYINNLYKKYLKNPKHAEITWKNYFYHISNKKNNNLLKKQKN